MNVYEVRLDGITKKVTADHYTVVPGTCGRAEGLKFYRIINDPNSTDKAKLVAEFTHYDYVTLESEGLDLKLNPASTTCVPFDRYDPWNKYNFVK